MKANTKKKPEHETISLGKLLHARKTIETLADSKANFKLSLKIFKFRKATDQAVEFYQEKLREIVEKFGQKKDGEQQYDDKGNALIDNSKIEDCRRAISELEVLDYEKPEICFEVEELETIELSANDIANIEEFIKGDN